MRRLARRLVPAGVAIATLAAAGCAPQGAPARVASPAIIDSTTFAPALGVDLRQFTKMTAGLYYTDVVKGPGVVASDGRKVTFRYAAFLPDGTPVETQTAPVEVELNDGMIRGLRLGLIGMRGGGARRLVVPPSLAYGNKPYGKIPANSVLVFDLELLSVR